MTRFCFDNSIVACHFSFSLCVMLFYPIFCLFAFLITPVMLTWFYLFFITLHQFISFILSSSWHIVSVKIVDMQVTPFKFIYYTLFFLPIFIPYPKKNRVMLYSVTLRSLFQSLVFNYRVLKNLKAFLFSPLLICISTLNLLYWVFFFEGKFRQGITVCSTYQVCLLLILFLGPQDNVRQYRTNCLQHHMSFRHSSFSNCSYCNIIINGWQSTSKIELSAYIQKENILIPCPYFSFSLLN